MANNRKTGFTLVELLIVITIMSVLAALLLPVLEQALVSTTITKCAGNLRQVGIGASIYLDENSGWFPGQEWLWYGNQCAPGTVDRNYLTSIWPGKVRECPTLPLTSSQANNATTCFTSYCFASSYAIFGYGLPSVKSGYFARLGAEGKTAQTIYNSATYFFSTYNTLPLACDSSYSYQPTGGYSYIAHTGSGRESYAGNTFSYARHQLGQNSVWLDGHVQWNLTPSWWGYNGNCSWNYPLSMAGVAGQSGFRSGWIKIWSYYAIAWCEKRNQ